MLNPRERQLLVAFNAGSSSIKLSVYEASSPLLCLAKGHLIKTSDSVSVELVVETSTKKAEVFNAKRRLKKQGFITEMVAWIEDVFGGKVVAAGHRVVHGGTAYGTPVKIDARSLRKLDGLIDLAPLHQPLNLSPIHELRRTRPKLPQIAAFDTSFHHDLPFMEFSYGIPRRLTRQGIRRFGFHGLSYEFISTKLREIDRESWDGITVIAHLGSGASLCATSQGRSLATTMGFSVLDGLLMATRSGSIDPGLLLYLLKERDYTPKKLEEFLYHECGLLGVSGGISNDLRVLHQSSAPAAKEAISLFARRVIEGIATMAAAAGGIDALVFTGGIGEADVAMRKAIADGCRWLGLRISASANSKNQLCLHSLRSTVRAWVIPTDEESVIAKHTYSLLFS